MRRKKTESAKENYILTYYQQIKNGTICVGRWIKLIYEYIVQKLESKEIIFDQKKANDVIEWIEKHCFHTEGPLAPNPLKLELWQKALLSCMFGLIDAKTGKRQFREIVLIIARKNGKTLFASAIAKYVWYVDGGFGARVYCIAPKLDQADLVYSSTWMQTQLDPEWQKLKATIEASGQGRQKRTKDDSMLAKRRQSDLFIAGMNAQIKKIAFSAKKSDGFNPNLAICDEIASWEGDKGLKQYDVMKSGMGAREMGDNPAILLSCSTSGYINDSIYDELIKRSTRLLLGDSKETRLLPFLYMIDDVEKWDDINELRKSNPNLGVSVSVDYLLEEIAIAEDSLPKKAEFKTKYCNIKQNGSLAWLNAKDVERSFTNAPNILEEFRGCYAVGGIDLSQTTDLTACVLLIEKCRKIYTFAQFFMPVEKIADAIARDNVPYNLYQQRGFLKPSGENFVDYHDCFNWFKDVVEKYEIYPLKIGYDRYSAQYLIQEMSGYGFNMDDVYQGENLTPVINETEGLIKDGVFLCGDNDLLKIHFLNSALKINSETNRKRLVKTAATNRIDGMAAFLDAMTVRQKWWDEIGGQLLNER